ncbi:hypothetical protein Cpir12675_006202 [Ceratocystis pirilliformis]|uniref:NADP-dependent oxidoreductase domain-containing protein n=1 Tax=Ceratocystis pirilliformis TaxID=259994 RepID=A0ABR3YK07_9PEZI
MAPSTIWLATGYEMPLVGFGIWKVTREATADTVYNGIRRAIADGLVKHEDLSIATKLWNNYHKQYFDLYLIHFPVALKYIDPAVHQFPLLYDVLNYSRRPISTLQIEHHPFLVQPNPIALAQESGIAVTGYLSFGPQSFLEIPIFKQKTNNVTLLEHPTIIAIAAARSKTPAQVFVRWATQCNIAVTPKSNNVKRLPQNLDVLSFGLTAEEIAHISGFDIGLQFNDPAFYLNNQSLRIFA